MRFLPLLSVVLVAVKASSASHRSRRALTQDNLLDFVENLLFVQDPIEGFFTEIDVGEGDGGIVLAQLDFQRYAPEPLLRVFPGSMHHSSDLFVGGPLPGAGEFGASSSKAHLEYSFFSEPVEGVVDILRRFLSTDLVRR